MKRFVTDEFEEARQLPIVQTKYLNQRFFRNYPDNVSLMLSFAVFRLLVTYGEVLFRAALKNVC